MTLRRAWKRGGYGACDLKEVKEQRMLSAVFHLVRTPRLVCVFVLDVAAAVVTLQFLVVVKDVVVGIVVRRVGTLPQLHLWKKFPPLGGHPPQYSRRVLTVHESNARESEHHEAQRSSGNSVVALPPPPSTFPPLHGMRRMVRFGHAPKINRPTQGIRQKQN